MYRTSIIPMLLVAAFVTLSGARSAHAEAGRELGRATTLCRSQVLRGGGYRDILTRLPISHSIAQRPTETSYRDASLRLPRAALPSASGRSPLLHRYALRPAMTCS